MARTKGLERPANSGMQLLFSSVFRLMSQKEEPSISVKMKKKSNYKNTIRYLAQFDSL
jgi:hypothetical protein